jgi:excisionase family DNA binding protein
MQTATQLEPISIDIPEACRLTSVGRSKLYQLMDAGEVRFVKVGKRRLVLVASLREWLAKLETGTAQAA